MSEEIEREEGCGCGCEHCGSDSNCDCGHEHCGSDSNCDCGHEHCGDHSDCGCEHKSAADEIEDYADVPLPKPTLITFATTLAQQAMIAMGVLPNPITRKATFMLNQASHLIDTIILMIDKTEGNRTDTETEVMNNIVHELRMLYVAAANEKRRRDAEKEKKGSK